VKIIDLSALLFSLVSMLFSITLGLYTWTRRHHKGALPLATILFSEGLWILGFIFEMLAGSLEIRVFWDLFQWLFGPILALALFELSSSFSKQSHYKKATTGIFLLLTACIIIVVSTNPLHHLVVANPRLNNNVLGDMLYYEYTSFDYGIMIFVYTVILISFTKLILLPIWSQKIYRLQLLSMLAGFGIIIAGSLLSLLDIPLFLGQRDMSPIMFGLSNLVLAWGLFRFHLFDVEAVARNVVVDTIEYPMVVVDILDQIVDFNSAAQVYFGFSAAHCDESNQPLKWLQLFERFRTTQAFRDDVSIRFGDDLRILDLNISPILNHGNLISGRLFFIKDITEQKQAEESVRETEESYTRLFNTVKEAIYVLSAEGVFLNVNEGAVKMYGYSREEFMGKTPAFVSADGKNDLQEVSKMLDRVFQSGVSEEFEFRGKRKNGEEFPKECIANKGKYFGREVIIVTARDVTERKKSEAELRQRTEDLELINKINDALNHGESIDNVIQTLNKEICRIFDCNDVSLDLFSDDEQYLIMQYTSLPAPILQQVESLIQNPITVIRIPLKETKVFKQIVETGESFLTSDLQVIHEILNEVSLSTTLAYISRPLVDELLPQVVSLLGFSSLILVPLTASTKNVGILVLASQSKFTESDLKRIEKFSKQITIAIQRRQVEETVREKEELFRRLITATPDAVLGVDRDGKIVFANEEATNLFGYSKEELIHSDIDLLVLPQLRNLHSVNRAEYVDNPGIRQMGVMKEPVAVRKDGMEIPVDIKLGYSNADAELLIIAYIRDITERRWAENAIRESENKFRSVIEHASDGITLVDKDGTVIEWNPSMEQITGLKRSDVIGQPVWDVVFRLIPQDRRTPEFQRMNSEQWQSETRKQYTGKDHLMEYPIEDLLGARKTVQSNGFIVETSQGIMGGVIIRDVTAQKLAETSLRESEERFRQLFDTAMDGIVFTRLDGSIHTANPAALALFGYSEQEVPGLQNTDLMDFSDPRLQEAIIERERTGSFKGELTGIHKDGTKFPVEINSVLFPQAGIKASNFIRDITERKRLEETLKESERQLRLIIDNTRDGINLLDLRSGRYVFTSPAQREITGFSVDELLSISAPEFIDRVHPEDRERSALQHRQLEEGAESSRVEYRWKVKSGEYRWFSDSRKLVRNGNGEPVAIVGVNSDITDLKSIEIERDKLMTELKNKNEELERFSYTVSHDLKAPLFTIQGFVGYLERDMHSNRLDRIQNDFDRITGAIDKMQRLLNELLALSRIGRVMNAPIHVSLGMIVKDAINLLAGRIADKQVTIEVDPDLSVIYCDRTRMTQVMQNLLDNAIKFMGGQPEPRIWIGKRVDHNETVFFVRDNGIGIPAEYQDRIFGLFDKLDPKVEGTGVGLAMVKRIIETHGGRIWVESDGEGKGSVFLFTVPG
jgi:PAS domain S-box-containing protein